MRTSKIPVSGKVTFGEKYIKSRPLKYLRDKPISLPLVSRMNKKMRYTKTAADVIGSWSWGHLRKWDKKVWDEVIFPHMTDYKTKSWSEIEGEMSGRSRRNKAYATKAICPGAKRRLTDIELEDLDEIFRFRIGNLPRLYGFRVAEVFFILWWDPIHKICPSTKADN
jgi:hypothetical protein